MSEKKMWQNWKHHHWLRWCFSSKNVAKASSNSRLKLLTRWYVRMVRMKRICKRSSQMKQSYPWVGYSFNEFWLEIRQKQNSFWSENVTDIPFIVQTVIVSFHVCSELGATNRHWIKIKRKKNTMQAEKERSIDVKFSLSAYIYRFRAYPVAIMHARLHFVWRWSAEMEQNESVFYVCRPCRFHRHQEIL